MADSGLLVRIVFLSALLLIVFTLFGAWLFS